MHTTLLSALLTGILTLVPLQLHATSSTAAPFVNYNDYSRQCVYISSYKPGYPWQDQLEESLKTELKPYCQTQSFYMDSKQIQDQNALIEIGLRAKNFIEERKPDIVIVSDDNAVQHVLVPHFKNHRLPFIFCGINNSSKKYNLPFNNTTGMIEIAPTQALLEHLLPSLPPQSKIGYLTTEGITADQNIEAFNKTLKRLQLKTITHQAKNQEEWRKVYRKWQQADDIGLIVLGNFVAFKQWDIEENLQWVAKHQQKLSIATQKWMMPYVAIGMTKSAHEQGTWAGSAAQAVLTGTPISQIPIVPNQTFQTWVNPVLANRFMDKIPQQLLNQAITFHEKAAR